MAPDDLHLLDGADRDLARRLGAAAGSLPDENVALAALHRRVGAARRRRSRFVLAAFVAGIVGLGSALAVQTRRSVDVSPSDTPAGPAVPVEPTPGPTTTAPPTTAPTTTTTTTIAPTTVPPTDAATMPPEPPATEALPPEGEARGGAEPDAAPATEPPTTETGATGSPAGTGVGRSGTAPAGSAVFSSEGGSIQVVVRDRHLVLDGVQPADGRRVADQEVTADRIVVSFASRHRLSTITVGLFDGRPHADVRESGRDSTRWDGGGAGERDGGGWDTGPSDGRDGGQDGRDQDGWGGRDGDGSSEGRGGHDGRDGRDRRGSGSWGG